MGLECSIVGLGQFAPIAHLSAIELIAVLRFTHCRELWGSLIRCVDALSTDATILPSSPFSFHSLCRGVARRSNPLAELAFACDDSPSLDIFNRRADR